MRRHHLLCTSVLLGVLSACGGHSPVYKEAGRSAEIRAEALLKKMTVEEKLGQLLCPLGWPMYEKVSADSVTISDTYRDFIKNQHGGMLWAVFRADPWTKKTLETGLDPTLAAKAYNALQRYAVDSTRLGIPIMLAEEAPHGHMAIGTTVFPTSIGLASTWDTELVEEVGRIIGTELRAQGASIGYGPVIDLSREPRWSRVEETYGEDVHLTSQMASAMVRGTSSQGIISTLKHFVAYGVPEGGHNGNPSIIGERDLRENVLPTFKAAINAGALSVMTSYNSLDGIPTTCNQDLLTGVLHDQWGFSGFVVSDLESIDGLETAHHVAASKQEAGELALNAGVDVDLGANCYALLKESVEKGRVSMEVLDRAVKRILVRKFAAGLFDNPYIDENEAAGLVRTPEHVELAAKAAREGVILLKNNGILPLKKDMTVALIGPNADNMYNQLGDYTAPQREDNVVTMREGLEAKGINVRYVKGCAIRDTRDSQIAQALIATMLSDVAVVVVGGSSARDFRTRYTDTGAATTSEDTISDMEAGEGYDRATLDLLGQQNELLKAVRSVGKPVVVVYIEGRPLDKNWASEKADALLTMWYPGGEGGTALADVLFGDYNPAGRLPVSVPRSVGQLPVYYNRKNPPAHDYVDQSASPLYPFGYGLSYTTFAYSDLTVSGRVPNVEVTVQVKNTGLRDGDEVVQLYVVDPLASTVRPRKQLRAFDRVFVKAGETVPVTLKLGPDAFSLVDREGQTVIEPGDFILEVGASSEDIRLSETISY